jgi:hypothetical protein
MSQSSTPATEAEPPLGDQPPPEDAANELTLDLEVPARADLTQDAEQDAAALDLSTDETISDEAGQADVTIDLPLASGDPLVGRELQKGKYRVLAQRAAPLPGLPMLGASYTALHTDLQRRLTIRSLPLDPQASAEEREQTTMQFLREVRVLAKLSHPSLPRVHDYFCEGEACYVVMDELAERTLADVLAEAARQGLVPASPPVLIAQLGLELARALGYLHQQRPPLVLGGLRPEDVALPADGPAQLMSLGALSMVPSVSSVSLPGFASMPTLPVPALIPNAAALADLPTIPGTLAADGEPEETLTEAPPAPAAAPARPPEPGDDLYSLGLLLRELAGGAEVVARVMERLQHPEEVLRADGADDAPPISLALAGVISIAAHAEPGRRFQSAAALETALMRAWMVERRIVRQAERGWRDERGTLLESGEDDQAGTSLDIEPPQARQHREMATRNFSLADMRASAPLGTRCWRCGGHNAPGAPVCRVCGARQPTPVDQAAPTDPAGPPRTAHRLPSDELEEAAWAGWAEGTTEDELVPEPRWLASPRRTRPITDRLSPGEARTSRPVRRTRPLARGRQRLLWGLVWACFGMAFLLGSASVLITYLALR